MKNVTTMISFINCTAKSSGAHLLCKSLINRLEEQGCVPFFVRDVQNPISRCTPQCTALHRPLHYRKGWKGPVPTFLVKTVQSCRTSQLKQEDRNGLNRDNGPVYYEICLSFFKCFRSYKQNCSLTYPYRRVICKTTNYLNFDNDI